MTISKSIAPHEALELHELITFKNVCATKAATMSGLVKDEELKELLQNDYMISQSHITELQDLVKKADWSGSAATQSTSFTNINL